MIGTRQPKPIETRLLETAIDYFGRHGPEGASTREIAAAAKTMMSSITYHYGGKKGLYLAAARHIGEQLNERMGAVLAASDAAIEAGASRDEAVAAVLAIVDRLAEIMTHPESEPWGRFIVREQMDPTEAFDPIFATMGKAAQRIAVLIETISEGRCAPSEARLRVLAILGQALAYRTARAALLRIMAWDELDADGVAAIRRIIRTQTLAILNSSF
ncbi:CerR family C-terminal domain-containing protein [Rhizorhabdus dicambivorans]|uniref:DUF1956 domain-containing protein n=1 Tax=Rhizorhabdus dicambivorans TaxID=1850238 RepID=A0A2A4FR82_9SPHN|nr:CerR family C-terminal domain-containing protein [Rhizorhabdus dicambivorans]ATE65139.1 DUF1956 domain-containing protein [Rhizorhabdus dicambivorans]PCE39911.1 DUF1956 domain-containing protein [Rhizorhabdus dicambivorans]